VIDAFVRLESVERHLVRVTGSVRALLADERLLLIEAASRAEGMIRDNWPVRTGLSRDSWVVYVEGIGLRFVNDVEYAQYVHFSGEVHLAWSEAFSLVDEFIVEPLVRALMARISSNHAATQPTGLGRLGRSPGSIWGVIQ